MNSPMFPCRNKPVSSWTDDDRADNKKLDQWFKDRSDFEDLTDRIFINGNMTCEERRKLLNGTSTMSVREVEARGIGGGES